MVTKLRSCLLHLGQNMWGGILAPGEVRDPAMTYAATKLRTDGRTWRAVTDAMARCRFNHAVVDLGEGVVFPSHPELAATDAWSADKLRDEVRRLKALGITAVPKLNFSTCHDAWLGMYGRMVGTPAYYRVVRDVIADACAIFERPPHFHLGLDEENAEMQKKCPLVVIRQGELWWHDFAFYLDCLQKEGARPIAFTGYHGANDPEGFLKRCPRDVIHNVGMYGEFPELATLKEWGKTRPYRAQQARRIEFMMKLGEAERDVLGCSSNWTEKANLPKPWPTGRDYPQNPRAIAHLHAKLKAWIPDAHYIGGLVAPWGELKPELEYYWISAVEQLAAVWDGTV